MVKTKVKKQGFTLVNFTNLAFASVNYEPGSRLDYQICDKLRDYLMNQFLKAGFPAKDSPSTSYSCSYYVKDKLKDFIIDISGLEEFIKIRMKSQYTNKINSIIKEFAEEFELDRMFTSVIQFQKKADDKNRRIATWMELDDHKKLLVTLLNKNNIVPISSTNTFDFEVLNIESETDEASILVSLKISGKKEIVQVIRVLEEFGSNINYEIKKLKVIYIGPYKKEDSINRSEPLKINLKEWFSLKSKVKKIDDTLSYREVGRLKDLITAQFKTDKRLSYTPPYYRNGSGVFKELDLDADTTSNQLVIKLRCNYAMLRNTLLALTEELGLSVYLDLKETTVFIRKTSGIAVHSIISSYDDVDKWKSKNFENQGQPEVNIENQPEVPAEYDTSEEAEGYLDETNPCDDRIGGMHNPCDDRISEK